jgi:hypothetical protein
MTKQIDPVYTAAFEAGRAGEPEHGLWSSAVWEAYQIGAHLTAIDADADCRLVSERLFHRSSARVESTSGTFEYRVSYDEEGGFSVAGQEV